MLSTLFDKGGKWMARVANKIAVVTGGALGMGRAFCEILASEGATVVVADIDEENGKDAVSKIEEAGGKASFFKLDVSSEANWNALVEMLESSYGKVDVLVSNAGIYVAGTTENTTPDEWDRSFNINVKGVYLGSRALIPLMRKSGGGSIINISSNWGIVGFPEASAYCATKGAVRLLTKATASEVADDGIRVNSVHPSLTVTHLSKDIVKDPETTKHLLGSSLLGRPADPEEIAMGILFLASDESRYMTGSELVMDGGYTAR
jgi:cyclopentanol dehydrogenase